jgi:signal transduction histidine kinase
VEDLLDVSRIQQGRVVLRTEELDLAELAAEVVERYRASCEQAFELTVAGPLVGSWDPLRLDQILTNLLSNAVKFSPPASTVRVSLRGRDDEVELTVTDQGVGIAPDELPEIFEPFVRGQEAGRISGNGLGLFITRSLVEQHGGRITMRSAPGAGTAVTVYLPTRSAVQRLSG